MSGLGFLSTGGLLALVALVIPLIIHFLIKRPGPIIDFPGVSQFSDQNTAKSWRQMLNQKVLLLIRLLIFIVAALLLAKPYIEEKRMKDSLGWHLYIHDSNGKVIQSKKDKKTVAQASESKFVIKANLKNDNLDLLIEQWLKANPDVDAKKLTVHAPLNAGLFSNRREWVSDIAHYVDSTGKREATQALQNTNTVNPVQLHLNNNDHKHWSGKEYLTRSYSIRDYLLWMLILLLVIERLFSPSVNSFRQDN